MFLYPPFSEDSSHCLLKQLPQFDKLQILAHCSVNHQPAPRTNVQDHFRSFPDTAVHVIVSFPLRPVARAAVHPHANTTSHCLWAHLELPGNGTNQPASNVNFWMQFVEEGNLIWSCFLLSIAGKPGAKLILIPRSPSSNCCSSLTETKKKMRMSNFISHTSMHAWKVQSLVNWLPYTVSRYMCIMSRNTTSIICRPSPSFWINLHCLVFFLLLLLLLEPLNLLLL